MSERTNDGRGQGMMRALAAKCCIANIVMLCIVAHPSRWLVGPVVLAILLLAPLSAIPPYRPAPNAMRPDRACRRCGIRIDNAGTFRLDTGPHLCAVCARMDSPEEAS